VTGREGRPGAACWARRALRLDDIAPPLTVLATPSDAYTIKLLDSVPRAGTDWLASAKP
jgi:hypothetical protein